MIASLFGEDDHLTKVRPSTYGVQCCDGGNGDDDDFDEAQCVYSDNVIIVMMMLKRLNVCTVTM